MPAESADAHLYCTFHIESIFDVRGQKISATNKRVLHPQECEWIRHEC
jgi:hypothetical protein